MGDADDTLNKMIVLVSFFLLKNLFSSNTSHCWLDKLRVMSSALLLGASTYQVPAARDNFIRGKVKKSETGEPLTENHDVNRSTARFSIIVIIINFTAHSSPPLHYANYLLAPAIVTIIAMPFVQQ